MCDSNSNCYCQYSTPPWWVTMGYTPPANAGHGSVVVAQPPGTVVAPPPATVKPGTPARPTFTPGSALGTVLGNTGSAVGNAVGTVLETPINVVGGVLSDVAGGVGSLLGQIS